MWKAFRAVAIFLVVGAIALEFFAFLLSKGGLLLVNSTPAIYLGLQSGHGFEWRTEDSPWGPWHRPNAVSRHKTDCFDVTYRSNSIGARDVEFGVRQSSKRRIVLLGDSFAEAMGVSLEKSAQSVIEATLNAEVLNFGASGGLGPVQYHLIYEQLARNYEHDGLVIFFLPANDFSDNDYSQWLGNGATYFAEGLEKYRPYYRKIAEDSYEVFYPPNAVKRSRWLQTSRDGSITLGENLKLALATYFWTANVLKTAKYAVHGNPWAAKEPQKIEPSGYFDAQLEQQKAAIHFLKKTIESSPAKQVILVSIPVPSDFARIRSGSIPKDQYWHRQFRDIEAASNGRTTFVDLADFAPPDTGGLFHACDFHWSELGNRWAGEVVARAFAGR